MLKVYSCGYGGNAWMAEELRPIIEDLGMKLYTIHEHENADIQWHKDTWFGHLNQADIIIGPSNYKVQPAKSANRVTQSMSMGKAIVCSPLPAYLDVAKRHPGCFLIADTPEEWKEKLSILCNNESFRKELGEKAKEASKEYSIDVIGNKWIEILNNPKKESESVDIVIPTYKNLRGLKLCLESIRSCTKIPYKIIIVNNGDSKELHEYLNAQNDVQYIKKDRLNFAQAINVGIKAGISKYVMLLNDDVIVSEYWLSNMIQDYSEDIGAMGLLSNCDKGWLHNFDISIEDVNLLPGSNTFEEIEPIIPHIYKYKSGMTDLKKQEWVAFYATLIPRKIIDEVGYLDESFINSGEDVDYCERVRKCGYDIIQTYRSFVFHFGAVSRKMLEKEDFDSYHQSDLNNSVFYHQKYSKKTIVIYSGPSWERWDHRNIEQGGIGGSEIWQINLSRELSNLGYRVINFNDCEKEIFDNDIKWYPFNHFSPFIEQNYIDYFISSRTTDPFKSNIRADKTYVQIHDVWMLSPKDQVFLDKVDKFCVLSQWHLDFASNHHNIPKEKMAIMANGFNQNLFSDINVERSPYRLHWSSSWDRGLDNVLYLYPFIKDQIPELELHIFYGVYNWKESCKKKNDQKGLDKIAQLEEAIKKLGIFSYGRVSQQKLAEEWMRASLWLYPSWFSETFCITAIEAQKAGVPVIANKYAGIITTIDDSGILLGNGDPWWPYTKEGRESFLNETVSILKNRDKWNYWSEKGKENCKKYSWKNVALMWQNLFKS